MIEVKNILIDYILLFREGLFIFCSSGKFDKILPFLQGLIVFCSWGGVDYNLWEGLIYLLLFW